ncbi:MAG: hypothetical protein AAGC95_01805 [Pseudomonadota bacterium]
MTLFTSGAAFALMSVSYMYGGYQLSHYAKTESGVSLLLSVAAYFLGNALLLYFLKSSSYGVLMVTSALAVLVGNAAVSAFVMGEQYTGSQVLGLGLAVIAVALVGFSGTGAGA